MAALLKERLRESTLTENYLVLPGQVLQPEAKGGVTPTENLGSQLYWAIRRSLTDHSTMHKPQLFQYYTIIIILIIIISNSNVIINFSISITVLTCNIIK